MTSELKIPAAIHGVRVRVMYRTADIVRLGITGSLVRKFEKGNTVPIDGREYPVLQTWNDGRQADISTTPLPKKA